MRKEIKAILEDWEYKITENPTTLIDEDGDKFVGLVANIIINDAIEEYEEEESERKETTLKQLEGLDDDQQLLLTVEVNYADEFDMSEWYITDVGSFKDCVELAMEHDEEISWYFGSNEELSYESGEEMLSEITIKLITDEESDAIESAFGSTEFGEVGFFDQLWDLDEEDEDEDSDDDGIRFVSKREAKMVEFLNQNNYLIKICDEDQNRVYVTHNDEVSYIPAYYIEELYKIVKNKPFKAL